MLTEERRRNLRVKLNELAYIKLDSGNGGIVLDVSTGGFGLQLAVPLRDQNTIRFRLSMASIGGAHAAGEVEWRDETKKRVGLQVTQLPAEMHEQVQIWLVSQTQSSTEWSASPAPDRTSAKVSATNDMELGFANRCDLELQASQRISSEQRNLLSTEKIEAVLGPGQSQYTLREPSSETGRLTPSQKEQKGRRSLLANGPLSMFSSSQSIEESTGPVSPKLSLAIVVFILTLVLGLCIGVVGYLHKRAMGELLIRLGEKISYESTSDVIAPTFRPAGRVDPESLSNGDMTAGQIEIHDRPSDAILKVPPTAVQEPGRRDSATANLVSVNYHEGKGSQSDLALARKYFRERSSPGYAAEAEKFLWSAIEKGNTTAEVELADHYLRGDDLRKNCEQAHVLLMAAAQSKSAVAAEQLADFARYDCK
jgi:hypothetical protein